MEPISASFEVGEPAPGRVVMQRAHREGSCSLSPGLGLEAKPFSVLADSTPHGNSVGGDVLQRHLPPRESNFLF